MTISKNPQIIHDMFNQIAGKYDINNNLISLGMHKFVKFLSVKNLDIEPKMRVLDECTGTGDFAKFLLKLCPDLEVVGIDFSENMLKIAEKKVPRAKFLKADCTKLPFGDETFDIATMGFGLRNIEDYGSAISESFRVLKSGGQFLHLDFGQKNLPSKVFDFIVPPLIKVFYGKNLPYEYLLASKREFPTPEILVKIFTEHGFKLKCKKNYLFGVISMQIFTK